MFSVNPELSSSNITAIFKTANEKVTEGKTNFFEKRTTMTGLFVKDDKALWAYVGDSRLYYFNDRRLAFQTKDHSVSQIAVDVGEITADQIRFHSDRSKLIKVLGGGTDIVP
jgi:serine/threonine protein phosphatase PrpC